MSQVYSPNVVVRTILDSFLAYRKLKVAERGLAAGAAIRRFTNDEIIGDMEQFGYVRLDATREAPRGARDWVVVLVLAARGKYAAHGPDLRKLLEGVESERPAVAGRLDELIVVAEEEFFGKKNLTDVVGEFQARQIRGGGPSPGGGPDPDGVAPVYNAYPYYLFSHVIPENQSVQPHRLMAPAEVKQLMAVNHLSYGDLPVIFANDPPVIWLGGREGQVVEITRGSETALVALYYRRIERRAF
jgi:DNA-directed RNA polymerase subunit H (RpoH/RPB5)